MLLEYQLDWIKIVDFFTNSQFLGQSHTYFIPQSLDVGRWLSTLLQPCMYVLTYLDTYEIYINLSQ